MPSKAMKAKKKLVRITTVPISLEKLLEGQLEFMQAHFHVTAISAEKERLEYLGHTKGLATQHIEMTRQITPWADLRATYKLYSYLKKEKPTIVHTHTPKAGIVGMLAAKLAGVPHRLHTVAGLPLMEATGSKRSLLDFVEKITYRCATMVYPNSKGLNDFIIKEKLTKPQKLKIIGNGSSNGIDTAYFDPLLFSKEDNVNLRKKLGIASSTFVFVFVGRLVGDKGINELVTAFSKLQEGKKQDGTVKLLLVGPFEANLDPLKPETLQAIESLKDIICVGYQEDVRPCLSISDALVFPSYREGFPNVVMQAGAMGLPSIVTDINGCNEIIENNVNGIIIPPKNSEALLIAMAKLCGNTLLYDSLKKNSREIIVSRYERREVWNEILKEYNLLLKR